MPIGIPIMMENTVDTNTSEKVCISLSHRPAEPMAYKQMTYMTVGSVLRVPCKESSATKVRKSKAGMDCIKSYNGTRTMGRKAKSEDGSGEKGWGRTGRT